MNKSIMLRIRVEPELKEKLEEAVKKGLAESMSELIRKAVLKLLETQAG
ncbi:MAG: ribbon-helix-helix protein, CopG family [Candidatus Bathyarchaeia archaeon]